MSSNPMLDRHPGPRSRQSHELGLTTVFTTAGLHPRDRFDFWHEALCRSIIAHDSRPQSRLDFEAELKAGSLADVDVLALSSSPMAVTRTMRHIGQAGIDDIFICRQAAGDHSVEQHGRHAALKPGDFVLLDPRAPYAGQLFPGAAMLILKVPRQLIEARVGAVRDITACAVRPTAAISSLASEFLTALPARMAGLDATERAVVEDQLLDLLATSLAKACRARAPSISSARSLVVMKLRAAIERQLTNPALDAAGVAAAAGVSVRYANAVLAGQNTSIKRLVLETRLAKCEKALRDPLQLHRTVSDIAYGWGFSDMTHFGRRFRTAYGLPPREYRRSLAAP